MKEFDCDVLIVGSGLTGLVCAYALSLLGYKIIITEQKKNITKNKFFFDTRTTAISQGSKIFLEEIDLWRHICKFSEKIKNIKVMDRNETNKINFFHNLKKNDLGYVVKNTKLINIIKTALQKKTNVISYYETKFFFVEYKTDNIIAVFNDKKISARLLVAADGKNSSVRELLNTPIFKKQYKENAMVVNFFHTLKHNNTAYEFFYKSGPLAILPMQSENLNHQSSIIWSNNKNYLSSLMLADKELFVNILEEKIGNVIGNIKKINSKQIFPLSSHINQRFYEKRVIYIGDSAHSIHPIAGQGWNIGLRDIKGFFELAKKTNELGLYLGTQQFCLNYNQNRFYDAYQFYQVTDKLNLIFKKDSLILNYFRSFGFNFIEKNINLKKRITNFAMGI